MKTIVDIDLNHKLKQAIAENVIQLPLNYFDNSILYDRIKMQLRL